MQPLKVTPLIFNYVEEHRDILKQNSYNVHVYTGRQQAGDCR